MAIKCSLLGHKFGESTVERDREEQGSEVIITIEETETCQRCGEKRVVSENKEVTSLEMPDDVAEEPVEAAEIAETAETAEAAEAADSSSGPDPGETEPESPGATADPEAEADPEPTGEVTEAEPTETEEEPPVTDDAEILDDEDDEDDVDRSPGEWPQEAEPDTTHDEEDFDQYGYMDEETETETEAETIDEEATDAEFIDEGPSDDEVIDGGPADLEDVDAMAEDPPAEAETNAWPSETEAEEPVEQGPPTGPGAVTVPDGEFVCRGCGFSTPVEESSLREGDFCPECHKETLVQVREQ